MTATYLPPSQCYLLYSPFSIKGERIFYGSLNKPVTPTLLFRFLEVESLQTNLTCFFIGKP